MLGDRGDVTCRSSNWKNVNKDDSSIIADHGVRSVNQTQKNQILNKNKKIDANYHKYIQNITEKYFTNIYLIPYHAFCVLACDWLIYDHLDNSGKTPKYSRFT